MYLPWGTGISTIRCLSRLTVKNIPFAHKYGYFQKSGRVDGKTWFAVTEYLKKHYPEDKTINYVRTLDGKRYFRSDSGCYRLSVFIDNVIALDGARNTSDFYESAVALAAFRKSLQIFPPILCMRQSKISTIRHGGLKT